MLIFDCKEFIVWKAKTRDDLCVLKYIAALHLQQCYWRKYFRLLRITMTMSLK